MIPTLLYLAAAFLSVSRGILEFGFGKEFAYVLQVGGIIGLLGLNISPVALRQHFRSYGRTVLAAGAALTLLTCASILVTVAEWGEFGPNYLFLLCFTAFLYLYTVSNKYRGFVRSDIAQRGVIVAAVLLGVVAIAQQTGNFAVDLPGSTFGFENLRVPSLTGSYLHYPLFLSVVGSLCISQYFQTRKINFLACGIAIAALIFVSLSRSGLLIILATVFFILFKEGFRKYFLGFVPKMVAAALLCSVLVAAAGESFDKQNVFSVGLERLMNAGSISSEGNDERLSVWKSGMNMLGFENIFTGSYFGLVTNSASESAKNMFGVVESSFLQQILNIGLVGALIYYGMLASIVNLISDSNRVVRCCVWSCLLQTFFYQSIEVIPFVFIFMTLPVISGGAKTCR
ncbi:hypothetical protein [Paraburkholderia lacunae]|uniref:Uncharacterized protein n=1 Tax=Paraburkholderia lacunae TaxID=2211104 RepID=A0A370NAZ5_9BURK|nr:hypothetical protein [Paraburkholderia lacunae]RDK02783.1 hypothetical protein DLM46_11065 [Paraburkholderia lacunae]